MYIDCGNPATILDSYNLYQLKLMNSVEKDVLATDVCQILFKWKKL